MKARQKYWFLFVGVCLIILAFEHFFPSFLLQHKPRVHLDNTMEYWTWKPDSCQKSSSFFPLSSTINKERQLWQEFVSTVHLDQERLLNSRGIVYTSYSNVVNYTLVSILSLRELGCTLPIEIWHLPGDLSLTEISRLERIDGVHVMNLLDYADDRFHFQKPDQPPSYGIGYDSRSYEVKGGALTYTNFSQILYLDGDNMPVLDPTYLFESPPFIETGALFWPDFWTMSSSNPVFKVLDIPCNLEPEQESGQLLIDKSRKLTNLALHLSAFMQSRRDFYFTYLLGDKDTFRLAFRALNVPYHMHKGAVHSLGHTSLMFCGSTMLQTSPVWSSSNAPIDGSYPPLFAHINGLKSSVRDTEDGSFIETIMMFDGEWRKVIPYRYGEFCVIGLGNTKPVEQVVPGFKERYIRLKRHVWSGKV